MGCALASVNQPCQAQRMHPSRFVRSSFSLARRLIARCFGTTTIPLSQSFFHALSAVFPAGETFFVKSVTHFRAQIKAEHPCLWGQVQLFLKQESAHSAVHAKWNARIAEQSPGHPMLTAEQEVEDHMKLFR